jgi:hypothetical protein
MRFTWALPLVLAAACSKGECAPGGASPEEAVKRWTVAIQASGWDSAANLMAPGYRDRWLVQTLAVLPAFGMAMPEVKDAFDRIHKEHGFTLDGLTFRHVLEEQHLNAIRERIAAVEDPDALLADVLRASMEMLGRMSNETGYPEDRGREPDWTALLEDTRTVEVNDRWFVVLELPTATESVTESR